MALTRLRLSILSLLPLPLLSQLPAAAAPCGDDAIGFDAWVEISAVTPGRRASRRARSLRRSTGSATVMPRSSSTATSGVFKQSFEQFSGRMIPPRLKRRQEHARRSTPASSPRIEAAIRRAEGGRRRDLGAGDRFRRRPRQRLVLLALATLAYDCRRSDFFTGQLIDALRVVDRGDLSAAEMRGGLHGELGQTQFLPSSYVAFAVDFDGNGRRDLIRSTADVLASTANYLKGYGWQTGQPWSEGSANFDVIQSVEQGNVYAKTVAEFARQLAEG